MVSEVSSFVKHFEASSLIGSVESLLTIYYVKDIILDFMKFPK